MRDIEIDRYTRLLRNWDRDFDRILRGESPRAPDFVRRKLRGRHRNRLDWISDLLSVYVRRLCETFGESIAQNESLLGLARPLLGRVMSLEVEDTIEANLLLRWIERIETCQRYICSRDESLFVGVRQRITECDYASELRALDPRRLAVRIQQSPDQVIQFENLRASIEACVSIHELDSDDDELKYQKKRLMALADDCGFTLSESVAQKSIGKMTEQLLQQVAIEGLAKEFRILQWEVMVRELATEQFEGSDYRYRFLGPQLIDSYMTLPSDFHDAVSTAGFMATQLYEANGFMSFGSHSKDQEWMIDFRKSRHEFCNSAFRRGIKDDEIERQYQDARVDQIKMFATANRRFPSMRPDIATVLVHDGEFSFFSLVWLIRHYYAKCKSKGVAGSFCEVDRSPMSPAKLRELLALAKSSSPYEILFDEETGKLSSGHIVLLLYQLGLGILIEETSEDSSNQDILDWQVIMTERYDSLLEWLNTTAWAVKAIRSSPNELGSNALSDLAFDGLSHEAAVEKINDISRDPKQWFAIFRKFLPALPVKGFSPTEYSAVERRWIAAMVGYFLSDVPHVRFKKFVQQRIDGFDKRESKATRLWTTLRSQLHFFEKVEGNIDWFDLLVSPYALNDEDAERTIDIASDSAESAHKDTLTCRLARVPYFPLEMMYRAYQTYQMHLLIMPQNFIQSPWQTRVEEAPSSVTFVTLAGHLPSGVFEDIQFAQSLPKAIPKDLQHEGLFWLIPYWNFFYPIASAFSMQTIEEGARQGGIQDATFSASAPIHHEMKRIFDAFRPGMPDFVVNEIRMYLMFFSMHSAYTVDQPDALESVVRFAHEESFQEFFERVQSYVMKSESIVEAARKSKFHIATSETTPEFVALMESHRRKLKFCKASRDLIIPACADWKPNYGTNENDTMRRCKFLLFAMCAAALANIKKNTDMDVVVSVRLSQDRRLIEIVNASTNEATAKSNGTLSVLRSMASELGPDAVKSVTLGKAKGMAEWITTLPIPKLLIRYER